MVNLREDKKDENDFEQDLTVVRITSKNQAPSFDMTTLTQGKRKVPPGDCLYASAPGTEGYAAGMCPC
jgi:hypothetical protein